MNFGCRNTPYLFQFKLFALFGFVLFLLVVLLVYQVEIAFLILGYQFLHVIRFTSLEDPQACSLVGSFCFSQTRNFVPMRSYLHLAMTFAL